MSTTDSDLPSEGGADEVDRPHLVLTLDTTTGTATVSGPYRTAMGALCAADVEYQVDRDEGGKGELTFHVARLHPPIACDEGELGLEDDHRDHPDHPDAASAAEAGARPLAQALSLLSTVAERTLRRRPRLPAADVTWVGNPPALGDSSVRRSRTTRHRHLLGREAR